jgi:hypothetical protein
MTHKNYPSLILRLGLALLFAAAVFVFIGLMRASKPKSFPSTRLADGRILQIEGVSFGTNNAIGSKSMLESVRPWLPRILYDWLSPKYPHNNIELEKPGLVVWVNAKEPVSGKHVDCQGIRVEFMDKNGDLLGEFTHSWFGGSSFWRVGHIFYAFPRTEPNLTLLVGIQT